MDGNLYSRIRDENEPQYGPRGANPLPLENSSWYSLAKSFDIGELDLDEFAYGMKFKGFKDLEISISPRELYRRDPKRFVEVLQGASAKASHMGLDEISGLLEKEVLGESKVNENIEERISPVYVVLMPLGKDTTLEDVFGEYTDPQGLVNLIQGSRNDIVGIYSDKNIALKKAQELVATAQREQWQYRESVNAVFDMTKDIIEEGNYSLNVGDKVRTYKGTTGVITKIEKWFSGHKVTVKMDNTEEEKVWQDNDLGVIEEALDPMAQHDEEVKHVLATIAALRQQLEALQSKGAEVERAEVYGPVFRVLDSLERSFRRYH